MRNVLAAIANDYYTLVLKFNDGTVRLFDAKPYLEKGIFTELKDISYFKNIQVAYGTVQWANEQDFAPETLYLESELMELKS